VLVLCMSAHAFGSDWARLEAGTFRFRDPLNSERRFIPLRLDEATIRGSLAQFLYISWLAEERSRSTQSSLKHAARQQRGLATQEEVNGSSMRRWYGPTYSVRMANVPSPAVMTTPCDCGTWKPGGAALIRRTHCPSHKRGLE